MTPFRAWRKRLGMSQREAAEALGYSWTQVQKFDSGTVKPPKAVRLAMAAISLGIKDLPPQG